MDSHVLSATIRHLLASVCPVYTPSDVHADASSLTEAFGLPMPAGVRPDARSLAEAFGLPMPADDVPVVEARRTHSRETASGMFGVGNLEWRELCEQIRCVGTTRKGLPRLEALGVRRAIMKRHGNDSSRWLSSWIGGGCKPWFARLLLPLDHTRPVPVRDLARAWKVVSAHPDSDRLRGIVRRCRDGIVDGSLCMMEFEDACADALGSWGELCKHLVPRVLCAGHPVARAMTTALPEDATFHAGARARMRELLCPGHYADDATAALCAQYVATGLGAAEVFDRLEGARRAAADEHARRLGIDPADYSDTDELESEIGYWQADQDMEDEYEREGLVILNYHEELAPATVHHLATALTTDDLQPLLDPGLEDECFWDDPSHLRACFERFAALKGALEQRTLVMRQDSRLCACYVLHGTYEGPHTDGMDPEDPLGCVVVMMAEMHFLYRHTRYAEYLRALDRSKPAKVLAVRHYLEKHPGAKLPVSLHSLVRKHGTQEEQRTAGPPSPRAKNDVV